MDKINKKIDLKRIKSITEGFLTKIVPDACINEVSLVDNTLMVAVKVDEPQIFINQGMETLIAVQHLLRVIFCKNLGTTYYVDLDINDYKKKRCGYLRELAVNGANQVALIKRELALSPMSAYERRVVHMELSQRRDIITESRGNGFDRRIIIKPA